MPRVTCEASGRRRNDRAERPPSAGRIAATTTGAPATSSTRSAAPAQPPSPPPSKAATPPSSTWTTATSTSSAAASVTTCASSTSTATATRSPGPSRPPPPTSAAQLVGQTDMLTCSTGGASVGSTACHAPTTARAGSSALCATCRASWVGHVADGDWCPWCEAAEARQRAARARPAARPAVVALRRRRSPLRRPRRRRQGGVGPYPWAATGDRLGGGVDGRLGRAVDSGLITRGKRPGTEKDHPMSDEISYEECRALFDAIRARRSDRQRRRGVGVADATGRLGRRLRVGRRPGAAGSPSRYCPTPRRWRCSPRAAPASRCSPCGSPPAWRPGTGLSGPTRARSRCSTSTTR